MSVDDQAVATPADDARFRTIFAAEPECVKLIGPDCSLIDMNPAGLRMVDAASIESIRGVNVLDLIDPAHRQAFRQAVDAVFQGASTRLQFEIVGLSGRRLWTDQSAAPLFDPNDPTRVVEMVAVTRDITQQRRAEAELLRAKLDAEAHLLTEEIIRTKTELLANISNSRCCTSGKAVKLNNGELASAS